MCPRIAKLAIWAHVVTLSEERDRDDTVWQRMNEGKCARESKYLRYRHNLQHEGKKGIVMIPYGSVWTSESVPENHEIRNIGTRFCSGD